MPCPEKTVSTLRGCHIQKDESMKDLFEQGRCEDAQKAATDEEAGKLMFVEFGLL